MGLDQNSFWYSGTPITNRPTATAPIEAINTAAAMKALPNSTTFDAGKTVAKLLNGRGGGGPVGGGGSKPSADFSDGDSTTSTSSDPHGPGGRKRRKQTHVPEESKDERYWARRLKNNEAAKRSRDMRIKREKVVFDENLRLEKSNADLKSEVERLATDNKVLHLKMDIIMDENNR